MTSVFAFNSCTRDWVCVCSTESGNEIYFTQENQTKNEAEGTCNANAENAINQYSCKIE